MSIEKPKQENRKLTYRRTLAALLLAAPGAVLLSYEAGVLSGTNDATERALQHATSSRKANDMEAARQFEENAAAAQAAKDELLTEPVTVAGNAVETVADRLAENAPHLALTAGLLAVSTYGMALVRRRQNQEEQIAALDPALLPEPSRSS